jgi:hypothetical protein
MPFRQNAFGENIAQPGTEFAEIDLIMLDHHGISMAEPTHADLFVTYDENYKIGGEVFIFGQNIEADEGEDDPLEASITFDNFGTLESARAWLDSIGVTDITEVE